MGRGTGSTAIMSADPLAASPRSKGGTEATYLSQAKPSSRVHDPEFGSVPALPAREILSAAKQAIAFGQASGAKHVYLEVNEAVRVNADGAYCDVKEIAPILPYREVEEYYAPYPKTLLKIRGSDYKKLGIEIDGAISRTDHKELAESAQKIRHQAKANILRATYDDGTEVFSSNNSTLIQEPRHRRFLWDTMETVFKLTEPL